MKRVVRKFDSFAAADRAEKEYYLSLTQEERLRIVCELTWVQMQSQDETISRLARI